MYKLFEVYKSFKIRKNNGHKKHCHMVMWSSKNLSNTVLCIFLYSIVFKVIVYLGCILYTTQLFFTLNIDYVAFCLTLRLIHVFAKL